MKEETKRLDQLMYDVAVAEKKLEEVNSGIRFQIGDTVVSSLSGRHSFVDLILGAIVSAKRLFHLAQIHKIRAQLFTGIPGSGLPQTPTYVAPRNLRTIRKYIATLSDGHLQPYDGPHFEGEWCRAVVALAYELATVAARNYPLPSRLSMLTPVQAEARHVLYITQSDPSQILNGYARRTRHVTRGLANAGKEVLALVSYSPTPGLEHRDGAVAYKHVNKNIESARGLHAYVTSLGQAIKEAAIDHKAGVIHAASNYLNGLAALCAARELGLPCIYEVRGLWEETRRTLHPPFGDSLGYRLQSQMEAFCAREADITIAGSSGIAEELVRRGVDSSQIVVAESGASELPAARPGAAEQWRQLFPDGSIILGFVGSLTNYEGFETISLALSELNRREEKYYLLVVGDGPFREQAKSLFSQLKADKYVKFAGQIGFDQVSAVYDAIDIALYPRYSTPVTEIVEPLKPIEALSAGVPVVVSDLSSLRPLANSSPGVFSCRPSDSHHLAEMIAHIGSLGPDRRRELGALAKAWVQENRQWMHTVNTILRSYRSITKERTGADP